MNNEAVHTSTKRPHTSNHIGRIILAGAMLCILLILVSCSTKNAGQHAAILMRDGSTLTGTVTATSASEITLAGDDNTAHQIPTQKLIRIGRDISPSGYPLSARWTR